MLTSYNGNTITYDEIGNPLSDGTWTYTWQHGRQLATMTSDSTTWSFAYNKDGLRTQKTNGTTTYNYIYNGSSLSQMSVGNDTLRFFYDANGVPVSVDYNGVTYYYATNIQGDVVAILDATGIAVVEYTYDAWGKPLTMTGTMASTLGTVNPIRYRGYVYDQETGLYYNQTRYYNPIIRRFINSDVYVSTGLGILGCNMFAYCLNNPVNNVDSVGDLPQWIYDLVDDIEDGIKAIGNFTEDCIECAGNFIESGINTIASLAAGHRKRGTTNPANREKHQNGDSRRQRDGGGEKKNQHKGWKPNPNKRNILFDGLLTIVAIGGIVVIVADDVTGVGVANDGALVPLTAKVVDFFTNFIP